jgi:DNA-binding protein YbaB
VNIGKMMKDLQKMQTKLMTDMETMEVEGSAGGGVVTARMNGKKELIAPAVAHADPDDPTVISSGGVNDASRKVDEEVQRLTQGMAGGLNLPGMR